MDDRHSTPTRNQGAAATRGSVLLEWKAGVPPRWFVFHIEDRLIGVLRDNPEVGVVDGNEVGFDGATVYLYGPDGEVLWSAVEQAVREFRPLPTKVIVTSGDDQRPPRELILDPPQ